VRFLLSPPPEELMVTRGTVREKQVITPNEPKEEEIKLGSSSAWGQKHLKCLGVKFSLTKRIDLNTIFQMDESEWTEKLKKSIISYETQTLMNLDVAYGVQQLEAVDVNKLKS
jgi:hypothetical protein